MQPMGLYLRYVVERETERVPKTIGVVRHEQDWVNARLTDELAFAFPDAEVALVPRGATADRDLIVVPYLGFNPAAASGVVDAQGCPAGCMVMLYGLTRRKVVVRPAPAMPRWLRRRARSAALADAIRHWVPRPVLHGVLRLLVRTP